MFRSDQPPPVGHLQCVKKSLYLDDHFGSATVTSSCLGRQTAQEVDVCAPKSEEG